LSIREDRLRYLEPLQLGRGWHGPPSNGLVDACVMEAVSYVAGEPFSDHPACASPILTSFLISWNDNLNDTDRQMLKPYIPRLVGTNTGKRHEEVRAWMLTDWLARECAPAFLSAAGLTEQARMLGSLSPLKSAASARKAQPTLDTARTAAAAAWDAAWNDARDAAWNDARDAAWNDARVAAWNDARVAARNAARVAAWDAAWVAAWNDARVAAWNDARAAARDAARVAAWNDARDAAWDAAWVAAMNAAKVAARNDARAAAWDAAMNAARDAARVSALLLLDRMIDVGRKA
jgi:hypothetical protein